MTPVYDIQDRVVEQHKKSREGDEELAAAFVCHDVQEKNWACSSNPRERQPLTGCRPSQVKYQGWCTVIQPLFLQEDVRLQNDLAFIACALNGVVVGSIEFVDRAVLILQRDLSMVARHEII